MYSAKKEINKIVHEQPEDASYDEILREIAFARMVERGLEDSKNKKTISHEDMKKKVKSWQK